MKIIDPKRPTSNIIIGIRANYRRKPVTKYLQHTISNIFWEKMRRICLSNLIIINTYKPIAIHLAVNERVTPGISYSNSLEYFGSESLLRRHQLYVREPHLPFWVSIRLNAHLSAVRTYAFITARRSESAVHLWLLHWRVHRRLWLMQYRLFRFYPWNKLSSSLRTWRKCNITNATHAQT